MGRLNWILSIRKSSKGNSVAVRDLSRDLDKSLAAMEVQQREFRELADGNLSGDRLERSGRIDESLHVYEALVARSTDTPFTYRRLAILYRKQKDVESEMRILRRAQVVLRTVNPTHHCWFKRRHEKLLPKTHGK